jgi:hypothetical protein
MKSLTSIGVLAGLLIGIVSGGVIRQRADERRPVSAVVASECNHIVGAVIVDTHGVITPIHNQAEFMAVLPLINTLPDDHVMSIKAPCGQTL